MNQNFSNKWILNLILSKFPLDALSSSNYPISYTFFYPVGPVPGWQVLLCAWLAAGDRLPQTMSCPGLGSSPFPGHIY